MSAVQTRVEIEGSPQLMLVFPSPLTNEVIVRLRESLDAVRQNGKTFVIDGPCDVYQLVDGSWQPLKHSGEP